jgi:signal transduction histidine kinase/ActR/RegA family two-component response regulator
LNKWRTSQGVIVRSPVYKPLKHFYWGLLITSVVTAILVLATFWLAARTRDDEQWVKHTLLVRDQVAQVLTLVQRVETTQRGFLLTGRDAYLAPYNDAAEGLPKVLDNLARLVADNPKQQQSVARLRQLVAGKLSEIRSTLDAHNAGRADEALAIVNSDAGLKAMNEIRELVSAMQAEESRLLETRQSRAELSGRVLQIGAGTAFLLMCAAGVLLAFYIRRSFSELQAAHSLLVVTNQNLAEQVSRREEAESRLRQAQKLDAIGQLTGGIAHDFNNMLGVISGSLELMKRRFEKGDFKVERFMEAALKATERAASLTHRLLAFARKQPLRPEPIDANRMIANMADLLRSTIGEQIKIEVISAGGLWTTSADAHQLESAILNIAINARDAMPEGGRLTIETANAYLDDAYAREHSEIQPGQFVMIAISDTGEGMEPGVMQRAFDPFFTTKPAGKGTGLGLSQVYGFVKQSRGHIKLYSEVGTGTTVKIYLPRLFAIDKEVKATVQQPSKTGKPSEVVLVVEDDPLMRRLTAESLRELGYTVLDSENGADALAILDQRSDISLLFTDVVMPEMSGKKLADEALRRRPEIKVLYTTGYTHNAVVHGGIIDPDAQLLTKPFTLEQVAVKLRMMLDEK